MLGIRDISCNYSPCRNSQNTIGRAAKPICERRQSYRFVRVL